MHILTVLDRHFKQFVIIVHSYNFIDYFFLMDDKPTNLW